MAKILNDGIGIRNTLYTSVKIASVVLLVFACTGVSYAEDISGNINATKVITEDSQLVGDVNCGVIAGPCIVFGAPNITLKLNGFTITGPSNPNDSSTCNPTSGAPAADLISNGGQTGIQIIGPGMVQKSKRHGILIVGMAGVPTLVTIKHVTSHHNCFSGILTNGMSESVIEGIVSVRNAANSGAAPCGGNCLVNSHNNHIWKNQFSGNGSVCPTATCTAATVTAASNNDFGMGLLFGSSGNVIEQNKIGGNTNGLLLQATAVGNIIRRNIIAGNPAAQVSRDYQPGGGEVGFDIKDEATSMGDRNTFDRNWCISYSGPLPPALAPCPSFPAVVPPTITGVTATPDVLWPPNNQMVPVTLAVAVSDDSDPSPVCQIVQVMSNDSIDGTAWEITGPLTLTLLAQRSGAGTGRTYTITVSCTNKSQLSSSAVVTVSVPHDQRR